METEELVEAVVKFRNRVDGEQIGLGFELIANLLAGRLGLLVPEPLIVNLSTAFTNLDQSTKEACAGNEGLNFGTMLIGEAAAWVRRQRVLPSMQPLASSIVAFDALVENTDRGQMNPNLLVRGSRIFAIDHEHCFSFVRAVNPGSGSPFPNLELLRSHPLLAGMNHDTLDLSDFRIRLEQLDEGAFGDLVAMVPEEWRNSDYCEKIRDRIADVRSRWQAFEVGIKGALG